MRLSTPSSSGKPSPSPPPSGGATTTMASPSIAPSAAAAAQRPPAAANEATAGSNCFARRQRGSSSSRRARSRQRGSRRQWLRRCQRGSSSSRRARSRQRGIEPAAANEAAAGARVKAGRGCDAGGGCGARQATITTLPAPLAARRGRESLNATMSDHRRRRSTSPDTGAITQQLAVRRSPWSRRQPRPCRLRRSPRRWPFSCSPSARSRRREACPQTLWRAPPTWIGVAHPMAHC